MKTNIHLWSDLAQFFLGLKMSETEVEEKIKTQILYSITGFLFQKSCSLWDNVINIEKPDKPQMTIWRMQIECWVTKATDTHSEYIMLTVFRFSNGWRKASRCWFIRKLFVLFRIIVSLRMTFRRSKYISFYTHKICCPNTVVFWLSDILYVWLIIKFSGYVIAKRPAFMPIGGELKTASDREYAGPSASRPKICEEVMERSRKYQPK